MPAASLDESLDRPNGLNGVRLALAGLVIVAHSFTLTGRVVPGLPGLDLGKLAVAGFFAVSGYLITGSRLASGPREYMVRRLARIMPGYLACLVAVAVVFAPAAAWLDGGVYSVASAAGYVARNVTTWRFQDGIAATLTDVPFPGIWNASTWSLPFELALYAGLGVLISRRVAAGPRTVAGLLAVASVAAVAAEWWVSDEVVQNVTWTAAFGLAGSLLRLTGHRVLVNGWAAVAAAATVPAVAALHLFEGLAPLPLAYALLCAGARLPLPATLRRHDVSYGTYVYGFPVQQLLVTAGAGALPGLAFAGLSAVCVAPFAVGSWLLVERPAMRAARRHALTSSTPAAASHIAATSAR